MNDKALRSALTTSLKGKNAHVNLDQALKDLNPDLRNLKPSKDLHTIWEELEHIRISQEDILKYMVDPKWESPKWPDGYWPDDEVIISDEMWEESINKFKSDLEEVISLVNNPDVDLTSEIPHASQHTYLREVLLVIDHNSYHVGQIVETRKLLANW